MCVGASNRVQYVEKSSLMAFSKKVVEIDGLLEEISNHWRKLENREVYERGDRDLVGSQPLALRWSVSLPGRYSLPQEESS